MSSLHLSLFILLSLGWATSAAYIPSKKSKDIGKTNFIHGRGKSYGPLFKSDWDIARYLKLYGLELMVWRCRNAIRASFNYQPLPYVELYCEVIGRMESVAWFHNGQYIDLDDLSGKYGHVVIPHYANGCFYSRWIDFKLRIYNATESDSGIYTFRATDLYGHSHEQIIYVDISEQKRKRSQKRHPSIQRLRQQIRPFAKSSAESEKSEGSSKEHLPEQEEVMKIKERKE